MKRLFANICCIFVVFGSYCSVFAIDATPTTSTVLIDNKEVDVVAYNIEGSNYFKLRDLAYLLNGSDCKFNIGYDVTTDTVYLTSGQSYIAIGDELQSNIPETIEVNDSNSAIIKDGKDIDVSAYNINGNNHFKLRDVGEEIGFKVDYDTTSNSILIETKKNKEQLSNVDENGFAKDLFSIDGVKPGISPTPTPH